MGQGDANLREIAELIDQYSDVVEAVEELHAHCNKLGFQITGWKSIDGRFSVAKSIFSPEVLGLKLAEKIARRLRRHKKKGSKEARALQAVERAAYGARKVLGLLRSPLDEAVGTALEHEDALKGRRGGAAVRGGLHAADAALYGLSGVQAIVSPNPLDKAKFVAETVDRVEKAYSGRKQKQFEKALVDQIDLLSAATLAVDEARVELAQALAALYRTSPAAAELIAASVDLRRR